MKPPVVDPSGARVRIAGALKPWRPAPFRRGPSPFNFAAAEARSLGQKRLSAALFDHPVMDLALSTGTTLLAAVGTAKLDGAWRILAWAILIGAGSKALVGGVRLFGPSPAYPGGAP